MKRPVTKDKLILSIFVVGSILFASAMWGLILFVANGHFWLGFISFPLLICAWAIGTLIVWLVTKLPFLPSLPYLDCAKYAAIIAFVAYAVHACVVALAPKLPEWVGYAVGVSVSFWACFIAYDTEKKKK